MLCRFRWQLMIEGIFVPQLGDGGLNVVKSVWQETHKGMMTAASPNSQDMKLS